MQFSMQLKASPDDYLSCKEGRKALVHKFGGGGGNQCIKPHPIILLFTCQAQIHVTLI
jgi:hypothetical protein